MKTTLEPNAEPSKRLRAVTLKTSMSEKLRWNRAYGTLSIRSDIMGDFFYTQGHKWKFPNAVGCDPRASSANIPVRFLKEYF